MKLKIKVKTFGTQHLPKIIDKGDWIDLRAAETVVFNAPQAGVRRRHTVDGEVVSHRDVTFDTKLIRLGVAMELPKGFEAIVVPRSVTPRLHLFQTNSEGVMDNSYNGDSDEWRFWATALADTMVEEGDRICQFRIQLSQKATFLQKLKWLLSNGIEIKKVEKLNAINRGGIGSTGKK